ncbi:MAG: lipopolysaccharide transport periplasmic protein LptA [Verrucomicrobiota bacterium]
MKRLALLLLSVTLTLLTPVIAQDEEETETTITSDNFKLDLAEKQGVFSGKVVVVHPRFELKAEEIIVFFTDGNKISRMLAKGNVKIDQVDKSSESREAEYFVTDKKIILSGNPVVMQGENQVSGNTITLFPDSDKMEVEGRSKVQFFLE